MAVSTNWGPHFGSPYNKGHNIFGSILGPPIYGSPHIRSFDLRPRDANVATAGMGSLIPEGFHAGALRFLRFLILASWGSNYLQSSGFYGFLGL